MQTTSKTDVFAFGVVLAELITGQQALARDKHDPKKLKTLVAVVSQSIMFLKFVFFFFLNINTFITIIHIKIKLTISYFLCQNDQFRAIFQDQDSGAALEAQIDTNLKGSYPIEEANKVGRLEFMNILLKRKGKMMI